MINFRKHSFASLSLIAAASGVAAVPACSNDDNNGSETPDSGTGGRSSGGSGGTGAKAGSGGTSTGGSGNGGSAGIGTGGIVITVDAGDGAVPDAGSDASSDARDAGAVAMFRFVHASPGGPTVDVYPKGGTTPIATNLEYGGATQYVALPVGSESFDLRPTGAATTTDPVFTTPAVDVAAGSRYTAVAEGNFDSTAAADRFRVAIYPEQFDAASSGKARVRIIHANYDGPTVDLDIDNDDPANPDVKALARFGDTGAAGIEIPADTNVQVGVVVTAVPLTSFTLPKIAAGSDVFIIATGLAAKLAREPLGLSALVVPPDSMTALVRQDPRLYALHVSPDAGPVDVFVGSKEVIDNTTFGKMSLVQVSPGIAKLDFFAGVAGPTTRPVAAPIESPSTPSLEAGNSYLAVVAGTVTGQSPTFKLLTVVEGFDLTTPAKALLRAVHGSANEAALDVGLVTTPGTLVTPPTFPDLSFADTSATTGASVPIGAETLGAAATGTTNTVADFAVTTVAGQRAFAVLAGDAAGGAHPLQLFVVDTTGAFWSLHAVTKN